MKLKKILTSLLLISFAATYVNAAEKEIITMPSAEVLKERFSTLGLNYFDEKTGIIEQLANEKKHPMGVVMALELCLYDYNEYMAQQPMIGRMMQINKPIILQALLKDHPEALEQLEKVGLYQPSDKK